MKGLDWDDLKIFATVARTGSVRAAANCLGVHHSTVARRIDHFEKRVGALLFNRTPEGLRLSAQGAAVFRQTERVQGEIDGIERALWGRDRKLAGDVRVTFPDAMGVSFLMVSFREFRVVYPEIALEFIASDDPLNLGRREADVAIRVTREPPEHLIGRPLGTYAVAMYASRRYLECHDPDARPEACNWLSWESNRALAEDIRRRWFPSMPSAVRCPNALLAKAAVEADLGVALLPCALADSSESIVRIAPDEPIEAHPIWLLTHPDLRGTARVSVLMQWIADTFERSSDLLMGRQPRAEGGSARNARSRGSLVA